QIEGLSRREAARQFGIDPRTVAKMLAFSVPPGYRRSRPPARPKLDPYTGIIDAILAADEARPKKQRHTSKRIFERLRDQHGERRDRREVETVEAFHCREPRLLDAALDHPSGTATKSIGRWMRQVQKD